MSEPALIDVNISEAYMYMRLVSGRKIGYKMVEKTDPSFCDAVT